MTTYFGFDIQDSMFVGESLLRIRPMSQSDAAEELRRAWPIYGVADVEQAYELFCFLGQTAAIPASPGGRDITLGYADKLIVCERNVRQIRGYAGEIHDSVSWTFKVYEIVSQTLNVKWRFS